MKTTISDRPTSPHASAPSPVIRPPHASRSGTLSWSWRWLGFLGLSLLHLMCVPPSDPACQAVSCKDGQTCQKGQCITICPPPQAPCDGGCFDLQSSTKHCGACQKACALDQTCNKGSCERTCRSGETDCQGRCTSLSSDPANCGACGKACTTGLLCDQGLCVTTCPTGSKECQGSCVRTEADTKHCGGCGQACALGQICDQGSCKDLCPKTSLCKGVCVDLQTSIAHCGACDKACQNAELCLAGQCTIVCPSGLSLCGQTCVDLQTSSQDCGRCGQACSSGVSCVKGLCGEACLGAPGLVRCGQDCVDLQTNPGYCGSCGRSCSDQELCIQGLCASGCLAPRSLCKGVCVDLQTNPDHCGRCESVCDKSSSCLAGQCTALCPKEKAVCNGVCVDPQTDPTNCGSCGKSCGVNSACSQGVCQNLCPSGETLCQTACHDLQKDLANCGACGKACASGQTCCGGGCVHLQNDPKNCGSCGTACPSGQFCIQGVCAADTFALHIESTGSVQAARVIVDNGRSSIISGYFSKTATFGTLSITATNTGEGFVAKASPSGSWLWVRRVENLPSCLVNEIDGMAVTPQGQIYVTGYFRGSILLGSITLTASGTNERFVAKLDSQGTWLWAKATSRLSPTAGNYIMAGGTSVDASGNFYIAGSLSGNYAFGTISIANNGYIAKIDPQGTWLWAKALKGPQGSTAFFTLSSLALDASGNPHFLASYDSSSVVDFGPFPLPVGGNFVVGKLDPQGGWLWATSARASDPGPGEIAIGPTGSVYVTGLADGTMTAGSIQNVFPFPNFMWIGKLSSQGTWVWLRSPLHHGNNFPLQLAIDPQGHLRLSERIGGPAFFGHLALTGQNPPLFLATLDEQGTWLALSSVEISPTSAQINDLAFDSQGRPYLVGFFNGSFVLDGKTFEAPFSNDHSFLFKGYPR